MTRPVLFGGDASYSIYLFHPMIAPLVPAVLAHVGVTSGWLSVPGSIAIAVAGGIVAYWLVEKPMTRSLRGRFFYAGRTQPATEAPATPVPAL